MSRAHAAIVLALALAPTLAPRALAREDADERPVPTLLVSGDGVVQEQADQAEISLSIVSDAATPEAALSANQSKVDAVRKALKALNLDGPEVFTSSFSIYPQYGEARPDRHPQIVGYQVSNTVFVRTKKMDLAGKVIQSAVNAGANRVESVAFTLSGAQGRNEAIDAAAKAARADAEVLAKAAGVTLGPPLRISLGDAQRPMPLVRYRMESMASMPSGGAPEPEITPGAIPVRATVTIEYLIVTPGSPATTTVITPAVTPK